MKKERLDTRIHLVAELEKLPRTPAIDEMIIEAKSGEYHDYKNKKYACGKVAVSGKLRKAGLIELAKRVESGDFDETCGEEDLADLRKDLDPNMWPVFGLNPKVDGRAVAPQKYPRIMGRCGQRDDNGNWAFQITIMVGPENVVAPIFIEPHEGMNYKTEKECQFALKEEVEKVLQKLTKEVYGYEPAGYFDRNSMAFTSAEQMKATKQ